MKEKERGGKNQKKIRSEGVGRYMYDWNEGNPGFGVTGTAQRSAAVVVSKRLLKTCFRYPRFGLGMDWNRDAKRTRSVRYVACLAEGK